MDFQLFETYEVTLQDSCSIQLVVNGQAALQVELISGAVLVSVLSEGIEVPYLAFDEFFAACVSNGLDRVPGNELGVLRRLILRIKPYRMCSASQRIGSFTSELTIVPYQSFLAIITEDVLKLRIWAPKLVRVPFKALEEFSGLTDWGVKPYIGRDLDAELAAEHGIDLEEWKAVAKEDSN